MITAERETIGAEEEALWKRIADWLRDGKTGQIVLNVNRGSIESYHLNEYGRVRPAKGLSASKHPC